MTFALIITAAGSSQRMGGTLKKEYLPLDPHGDGSVSVLSQVLYSFLSAGTFQPVVITIPPGGAEEAATVLARDHRLHEFDIFPRGIHFTEGGASRQASVLRGMEAVSVHGSPDAVLIHDGARPWITPRLIRLVCDDCIAHGASVPGMTPVDTQKEIDGTGTIVRHLQRDRLVSVQTPQAFLFLPLLDAHRKAATDGEAYTDDTAIWSRYAGSVHVCSGEHSNKKITWPGDIG